MTDVAATRFGPPLPDGGTIGVCSPSGPYFNRSDILRPVEWWEAKGYRVKLADGAWAKDDYVAGSPEQRAADLNALFADPEVDVIQVLWGGTGAIDVLPHLDYDLIAANPKALMGYSDITNLHIAIRQRTGLATFHGPGLGSMGIPERTDFTWNSALEARDRADALARASMLGRAGGYGHVYAFPGGEAFTIETTGTRHALLDRPGPHTNHYQDPELAAMAPPASEGSTARLARLRTLLAERDPRTPDQLMDMMRDHDSAPQAICLHPDPDEGEEASACLFSMVADVEARRMWVAEGNPCEHDYFEIDLNDEDKLDTYPPALQIQRTNNQSVELRWESLANFRVQSRADLGQGNWVDEAVTPYTQGSLRTVQLPLISPNRFLRLVCP